jgi:hypothetical protein
LKTVKLSKCIVAVAALAGISAATQLTSEQRGLLITYLGEALREAWNAVPWWQCEAIEERWFAPEWEEEIAYEAGDLVRVTSEDEVITYYRAINAVSAAQNGAEDDYELSGTLTSIGVLVTGITWGAGTALTSVNLYLAIAAGDLYYTIKDQDDVVLGNSIVSAFNTAGDPLTLTFGTGTDTVSITFARLVVGDFGFDEADAERIADTPASAPADDEDNWEEVTDYARVIELSAIGATVMGAVLEVWCDDPRECAGAHQIPFVLRDDAIVMTPCDVSGSVWVVFQRATPALDLTVWVTGETIAQGDVRYDVTAGDCYRATAAISSGSNTTRPAAAASSWAVEPVPEHLETAINLGASVHYLRADGQEEKATRREAAAGMALERAIVRNTIHQQQNGRYARKSR